MCDCGIIEIREKARKLLNLANMLPSDVYHSGPLANNRSKERRVEVDVDAKESTGLPDVSLARIAPWQAIEGECRLNIVHAWHVHLNGNLSKANMC